MTKNERWILSEWQVCCHRRAAFAERLFMHRERTPYAEIDLVFEANEGDLILIEVKTIGIELWGERSVITRAQSSRLARARIWLESRFHRRVIFLIAVVSHDHCFKPSIQYFEAGADWLLT